MSNKKILAVTGLTRCGSSMMMRMLHHGGMDVLADNHSSYEDRRMTDLPEKTGWLREAEGKAVKLLDSNRFVPPREGWEYVFILLHRDPKEQSRSMAKFLRILGGQIVKRKHRQAMQASIRGDMGTVQKILARRGPVFSVKFERVLSRPLFASQDIACFLGEHGIHVDPTKMAEVVVARSPKCYDGLLELEMADG
ncbi:MAG: hypothetical protein GY838_13140 [bacterium]|nr:hypothetical protein [bacterium]